MLRSELRQGARVERAEPERRRKVALVVVHGVGESEPGYAVRSMLNTLSRTCKGYTADEFSVHETQTEETAPSDISVGAVKQAQSKDDETEPTAPVPYSYPVFRRSAKHDGGIDLQAVELFWADTTTLHPGRLNTLLGLFRIIFESQHVVHAMLNRGRDAAARVARSLLLVAAWLLRGPIAALTIATSAFCTVLMFEPEFVRALSERQQFLVAHVALFAIAFYLMRRIVQHQDFSWYDTATWLAIVCVALIAMEVVGMLTPLLDVVCEQYKSGLFFPAAYDADNLVCAHGPEVKGSYVNGTYRGIIVLWRFWGALVFLAVVVLGVMWVKTRGGHKQPAFHAMTTSIGILVLQFLLWVAVVVTSLYWMLIRAESNHLITEQVALLQEGVRAVGAPDMLQSKYAAYVSGLVSDGRVAEIIGLADIAPTWIVRFKFIYLSAILTLLALFGAILILMVKRHRLAKSAAPSADPDAQRGHLEQVAEKMPRLLFNQSLIWLLILCFIAVFGMVLFQVNLERYELFKTVRGLLLTFAALIVAGVSAAIGSRITNVVHIARDLIDHHYRPSLETTPRFLNRTRRREDVLPRRERIRARLIRVLEAYVKPGGFDEVIFVAHSQGSVIAYDYVRDHGPLYAELGGAQPSLLTFGSPLGTIYQSYFDEYEQKTPVPDGMRQKLKRWVNLYRVDDYIGGRIEPPEGLQIDNVVMKSGPHRHTEYWLEVEVARALDRLIAPPPVASRLDLDANRLVPRSMPRL